MTRCRTPAPRMRRRVQVALLLLSTTTFNARDVSSTTQPQTQGLAPLRVARIDRALPAEGAGYVLNRISGIVSLNDQVYVLSNDEHTIRVFDQSGRLVRSIGREGSGPGEFRMPRLLGHVGDSLWTWDISLSRISVFHASGTLVRTVLVPRRGDAILLRGGGIGVFTARTYGSVVGQPDSLLFQVIAGPDTSRRFAAVATYRTLRARVGGQTVVGQQPFDDDPLVAKALNGSGFAFVERRSASRNSLSHFIVTRIGPGGDTIFRRRITYPPLRLTAAEIDSALSALVRPFPREAQQSYKQSFREALYVPAYLPPVSAALIGADETVWLRREQPAGRDHETWLVLRKDGVPIMNVAVDRGFLPLDVNGNVLWGIVLDADGTSRAVRLRLSDK
jgi:hypothetical protein